MQSTDLKQWFKSYPDDIPKSLDYPDIPLYEILEQTTKKYPDKTATIFYNAKLNYKELYKQVNALAKSLQDLGVQKGDRVSIMLPNTPQLVIAYYAALKIGAIVVQTNPLYKENELKHQMVDSGSKAIISLDMFYPTIQSVRKDTHLENVILTSLKDYLAFPLNLIYPLKEKKEGNSVKIPAQEDIIWFNSLVEKNKGREPQAPDIDPNEDLALIQYTGGTTGTSKGAMLTHKNLVSNIYQMKHWIPDLKEGEEVTMGALPFFHVYGMTACMNYSIAAAGTLILVPKFEVNTVLKLIKKYKPTLFPGVPTMYIALLNHPDIEKYDISSIRVCLSGAAPLPVKVQKQFEEITGGKLVEAYGLSETSPAATCNLIYGHREEGSIGIPVPDTDCKVINLETEEEEVPIGERGELAIKGPQVMKGYWNMPEETEAVLRDGWFYTGDIAIMDENGFFYIVDRKKDVILAGGFNIYPRDIEEVLYKHPKISEACVIGVSDDYRGETVKAYVVPNEGENLTESELEKYCKEHLASYKVPKIFELTDELPKTLVGKVLRRSLREQEETKAVKETATSEEPSETG
ncbi:long-chain-fatty-acid--CoA ligase [Natranaerofaba carboxydovora]|uniref:long-chain-fatty-acid--CoA ligase n=1 Tax=Natranaerofaba carboxydovora TaxID=2742683 RepID=UPI001F13BA1F|nr:long-chain fatty acid--CoA ligase [Natranaerofaba carboxydovora]UMZ74552.1 Long-chain-fatty-acid--CoA ligase [Natranaerofaba carboxydovora]